MTASLNISVWTPRSSPVAEFEGCGGRNRTDAQLDRGPVGDELRDERADPALHLADRRPAYVVRPLIGLHAEIDLVDMDEAVAKRAGHRPVELDDDSPGGRRDRGVHRFDRGPQRAEAVFVGRGGVHEDRVERKGA